MYEILGATLDRVLQDLKLGPKFAKTGIIVKFIYTDPDGEVTIDLQNPPIKSGYHGNYYLGPCDVIEEVWSKQSADFSHSFWHGFENPMIAIVKGKIKQGGNIAKMLKLIPVLKPVFKLFPIVLADIGYEDLIIKKKKGFFG